MDIYEPEGTDAIVDLRRAADELGKTALINHEGTRRQNVAEIQTAALLDIALSLRVVAAEARAAMGDPLAAFAEPEPEGERDFLVEGDLVQAEGYDEPGEIKGFGVTEDTMYAEVLFAGGGETRVWLDQLTRIIENMAEATDLPTITTEDPDAGEYRGDPEDDGHEDMPTFIVEKTADGVTIDEVEPDVEDDFVETTALDTLKAAKKATKKKKEK